MTITTRQVLMLLYILSWLIFVGISIEAGGFLFNMIYDLGFNPAGAKSFWEQLDLSALYAYDRGHFFVITLQMSIVAVLRAVLFYLIIKLLHDSRATVASPFNRDSQRFLIKAAFVTLLIGLFSHYGAKYHEWLEGKGIALPDIHYLRLGGADVWLFMSVTLYVIAQIFKKGIELQTENDLTI